MNKILTFVQAWSFVMRRNKVETMLGCGVVFAISLGMYMLWFYEA
jgi:hypothetical protein